jgi:hypothetical protein
MSMIVYTKGILEKPVLPRAGITHIFNALLSTPNMNSNEEGSIYFSPLRYRIHRNSSRGYLAK